MKKDYTKRKYNALIPKEEGVYYSDKSKKFVVFIENTNRQKGLKPLLCVAQFEEEEKANEYFKTYKK